MFQSNSSILWKVFFLPGMEDNPGPGWKMTFNGREPLIEDELGNSLLCGFII